MPCDNVLKQGLLSYNELMWNDQVVLQQEKQNDDIRVLPEFEATGM